MDDNALLVDTNVLVYANVIETPFHEQALAAVNAAYQANRTIWISRQVIREYLVTMTRPQAFENLLCQLELSEASAKCVIATRRACSAPYGHRLRCVQGTNTQHRESQHDCSSGGACVRCVTTPGRSLPSIVTRRFPCQLPHILHNPAEIMSRRDGGACAMPVRRHTMPGRSLPTRT